LFKFCENGRCIYGLRTLLRAHQLPHFLINSKFNMVGCVDLHKVATKKSAFSAFPKCIKWKWKLKNKKTMKKRRRRGKRPNVNLILSHVNHTFLVLDLRIGAQVFRQNSLYLEKNVFLNMKKGAIQGSICFKLILKLLVPRPFV